MRDDAELLPSGPGQDEEALYIDEHGVPMLFDVVLPGDRLQDAGVSLDKDPVGTLVPARTDAQTLDLDQRIRLAIEAALPKVTERTAALMRDALLKEVQDALDEPDEQPR